MTTEEHFRERRLAAPRRPNDGPYFAFAHAPTEVAKDALAPANDRRLIQLKHAQHLAHPGGIRPAVSPRSGFGQLELIATIESAGLIRTIISSPDAVFAGTIYISLRIGRFAERLHLDSGI